MSGVFHGGVRQEELEALGIDPVDVLDLSASLNPFGAHSHVLLQARDADIRRYPEPDAGSLRDAIAEASALDAAQVLVTAGATAALHLAVRALVRPGDECAIWPPTFGEYAAAIAAADGRAVEYRAEPPDFQPNLDVQPAAAAVLCNPNNPTGFYLDREAVKTLAGRIGGTLVLDVAYDPFVADAWDADDLVRDGAPVLVVHSMTKLHATPGVRLGYVVGAPELIARLSALQPSWSIDAPAITAGHAMLEVERMQRRAVDEVTRVRALLADACRDAALEVADARANFLLVRVGDAPAFRERLLRRGFAVRDCTSFGLPEWVRVAVPVEAAARRLISAFMASLDETAQ